MTTRALLASTILFASMSLAGFATEQGSNLPQPIELRKLSFLPPSGDGWEGWRDTSYSLEYVLFKTSGSERQPMFAVVVWQYRTDEPVTSEDDLWAYILQPYRDALDAEDHIDISKTQCQRDQSLTKVGLRCMVEGTRDVEGGIWWSTGTVQDSETVEGAGHVYAFVFPNDNREIGVIEYFQQVLPDVPPVDTSQRLRVFVQNATLIE